MPAILQFIGQIVLYGGSAAAIAYAAFVWFGQKWLEDRFTRGLEVFRKQLASELEELKAKYAQELEMQKHTHDQQLEQFKFQVNALFSRVSKIHEIEFRVLPKVWKRLLVAHGIMFSLDRHDVFYHDFPNSSEADNRQYLEKTSLTPREQQEILDAVRENRDAIREGYVLGLYLEKRFWHELAAAKESFYRFHNYLLSNKIFLSKELFTRFEAIDRLLLGTLTDIETSKRLKTFSGTPNREEAKIQIDSLAELIQERLHWEKAV